MTEYNNSYGITVEEAAKGIRLYCETVSKDPLFMMLLNLRMSEIEAKEKEEKRLSYKIKTFLNEVYWPFVFLWCLFWIAILN